MDNIGKSFKIAIMGIFSIASILLVFWFLSVLFYGRYGYTGYYGMGMMFGGGIFIMIVGMISIFFIIGILFWLFSRDFFGKDDNNESLKILEERYARGEISREVYLKIREDLKKY
jgi:putative membrane protein